MPSKPHPLMKQSQLTREILCWLLQRDTTGCFAPVARAEIAQQFPNHDLKALDTALIELESRGLVTRQPPPPGHCSAMGEIATPVAATLEAALQAGHHATGYDIDDDAIRIARKFLKNERYRNIPTLYDRLGWDLRRLNPPLLLIRSLMPAENFSAEPSPLFAFIDFTLTSQTKATLQAWVEHGTTLTPTRAKSAMTG